MATFLVNLSHDLDKDDLKSTTTLVDSEKGDNYREEEDDPKSADLDHEDATHDMIEQVDTGKDMPGHSDTDTSSILS